METKIKFKIKTKEGYVTPEKVPANNIFRPSIMLKVNGRERELGYECSFDDTITYDENEKVYIYCDSGEIDRMYGRMTTSAQKLASSKIMIVYFEFDTIENKFCGIGDGSANCDGYFLEIISMSFRDDWDVEEYFVTEKNLSQFNKAQEDRAN